MKEKPYKTIIAINFKTVATLIIMCALAAMLLYFSVVSFINGEFFTGFFVALFGLFILIIPILNITKVKAEFYEEYFILPQMLVCDDEYMDVNNKIVYNSLSRVEFVIDSDESLEVYSRSFKTKRTNTLKLFFKDGTIYKFGNPLFYGDQILEILQEIEKRILYGAGRL